MAEQEQERIAQLEQIRDDLIARVAELEAEKQLANEIGRFASDTVESALARIAELEAGIDRIATRAEKNIHSSGYVARQLRELTCTNCNRRN